MKYERDISLRLDTRGEKNVCVCTLHMVQCGTPKGD